VSGSASFKDRSFEDSPDGVVVKLDVRGLPKPNTFYLAHIHPGTCAKEAKEGHAHEEEHGEHPGEGEGQEHEEEYVFGHGEGGEASYALSQVKSNSEGRGSSTTMFGQLSVDKLFSGKPKHVMVHEAGSGNPPILTCADLERAG
jgi:Cu/Zn superoxide dismutase